MIKSITINVATDEYREASIPDNDFLLGGRALSSKIIASKVPPEADPIGPFNVLTFCCGVLAGTTISNSNRVSAGGKSPLTGTIKESNSGGTFGYHMGRLGIRSIILEGKPVDSADWKVIIIGKDGIRIENGSDLAEKGCHEKAELLVSRYGKSISYAMIGPAAEKLMRSASIVISDMQHQPARFCGRGGLGAVMGSKGIQAIILDSTGTSPIVPDNKDQFKATSRIIAEKVNTTPQTAKMFKVYGTAAMVDTGQGMGFLPTRNFTRGCFDQSENINGETMVELIEARGGKGKASHACMPGCLVQCSNVFPDEDGNRSVSPLEYETIGMMGSNLEIGNLDTIARMNYLANDSGIDSIEVGAAIGIAMQAGLADFGDETAALEMMKEVRQGSVLGRLLGSGAEITGKVLGIYQVPTAKGQAFPAYDPRGLKGLAATYATSPMGADHTAGHTIRSKVDDHHSAVGQAEASKQSQIGVLQWDALGFCYFIGSAVPELSLICDLVDAVHSRKYNTEEIREIAIETLKTERDFNRRAGFGPAHDRLNEFFHTTVSPDTGTTCDIPEDEIRAVMNDDELF